VPATIVVGQMGPPPWSRRLVADERQLVTLMASPRGGGNRPHWHREFDEWWAVLAGRLLQPLRAVRPHRRSPARVVRVR
jgi:oxalate decarboxylase/phosphoglucose isomerase-like protein (cupin superfamily)